MAYTYKKTKFRPKRPIRSFRDLEVYQKSLEGAVLVAKNLLPVLKEENYPLYDDMAHCSLEIPRFIAEAHSQRFNSQAEGLVLLDKAMNSCNKMVVYLEQARDIYSDRVERALCEELINRYSFNRRKIFNLYKAWERFAQERK